MKILKIIILAVGLIFVVKIVVVRHLDDLIFVAPTNVENNNRNQDIQSTHSIDNDNNNTLYTYYTNAVSNVRECESITCKIVGVYPANREFELPFSSLDTFPEWVELYYTEDRSTQIGYMNKIVFSKNLSITTKTEDEITDTITLKSNNNVTPSSTIEVSKTLSTQQPIEESNTVDQSAYLPEYLIRAQDLSERKIFVDTSVLVRCTYNTQYFDTSTQPWNEQSFTVGSGVIVSKEGHVLTAGHVIRDDIPTDNAGRVWARNKCEVAITDNQLTPIVSVSAWGQKKDERFIEAKIVYETDSVTYNDAIGVDMALLKINKKFVNSNNYSKIVPLVVEFKKNDELLSIGYPGKISLVPQVLERFDGRFESWAGIEGSTCTDEILPCGWRYKIVRSVAEYQNKYWTQTPLGVISPLARPGFSGAPVFYKGNLVGIITHGQSGNASSAMANNETNSDVFLVLTSFDVYETLKTGGYEF